MNRIKILSQYQAIDGTQLIKYELNGTINVMPQKTFNKKFKRLNAPANIKTGANI